MFLLPDSTTSTKEISLTQGKVALVSPEDFDRIGKHRWQAMFNGRHWYAVRRRPGARNGLIYMHRAICGSQPGQDTDHVDRSATLDNRRSNLRPASRSQNQANRGLLPTNTTGFTGVKATPSGKFVGTVTKLGRRFYTKVQGSLIEAARARDVLAAELFGQFAISTVAEQVPA